MDTPSVSRRSFVAGGVASAVAVGIGLDRTASARAAAPDDELFVGRFVRPQGRRAALVASIVDGEVVSITLDSTAFVAHGADGVVDSLTTFVPDEEIVACGPRSQSGIVATDFQSVYTRTTGTIAPDGEDLALVTSSGQRIHVPGAVAQLHVPAGVETGGTYSSTIWTHPRTGQATAVDLEPGT